MSDGKRMIHMKCAREMASSLFRGKHGAYTGGVGGCSVRVV